MTFDISYTPWSLQKILLLFYRWIRNHKTEKLGSMFTLSIIFKALELGRAEYFVLFLNPTKLNWANLTKKTPALFDFFHLGDIFRRRRIVIII